MAVCTTDSGAESQRVAEEAPSREQSRLHPADWAFKEDCLQVVEIKANVYKNACINIYICCIIKKRKERYLWHRLVYV